jgi:D-alanyl-D-alanine carboxypeptidase (penicillin-binding protein 5/6)
MKQKLYSKPALATYILILVSVIFPYQLTQAVVWPEITATSAYVYDPIANKVLYTKNADEVRPIASLNKLMTAAVADTLLSGSKSLQKPIKVNTFMDANRADKALQPGTYWEVDDLITYMLVGSSNKAAESIASNLIPRESFMSLMNFTAKRFGLQNTTFHNPTGLTEQKTVRKQKVTVPSGHSTAKEVALMLWKIIESHPGLLETTQLAQVKFSNGISAFAIDNTNKILSEFPIVVGKTGFTEDAGGNLAVVLQKTPTSHAYVIVVLGSTPEGRFNDVAALASTTLSIVGDR